MMESKNNNLALSQSIITIKEPKQIGKFDEKGIWNITDQEVKIIERKYAKYIYLLNYIFY